MCCCFLFVSVFVMLIVIVFVVFVQMQIDDEWMILIVMLIVGDIIIFSIGWVMLMVLVIVVIMDSDNDVIIDGDIDIIFDDDGVVVVYFVGGNIGDLFIVGDILILFDIQFIDEGEDEGIGFFDFDGLIVIGGLWVGILINGIGVYVGDVYLVLGGLVIVQGNDFQVFSVLMEMIGGFDFNGVLCIIGDWFYVINLVGDVFGDLIVNGSVSVMGEDFVGIEIFGDLGGMFYLNNVVIMIGYQFVNCLVGVEYIVMLDVDDCYQSGVFVLIFGSIVGGVFFDVFNDDNNVMCFLIVIVWGEVFFVYIFVMIVDFIIGEVLQWLIEDDLDMEEDESQLVIVLGYFFVNCGVINVYGELDDINVIGICIDGFDDGFGGFFIVILINGLFNVGQIFVWLYSNEIVINFYGVIFGNGVVVLVFINIGIMFIENIMVGGLMNFGSVYFIVIESEVVFNLLINFGVIFGVGLGGGNGYVIVDNFGMLIDI